MLNCCGIVFLHFTLSIPVYVHDSERFHEMRKKKKNEEKKGNGMRNSKKRVIQGMRILKKQIWVIVVCLIEWTQRMQRK